MITLEDDFHNDLRFDEFLMLGEAETNAVVALLSPVLDAKRQRALKSKDAEAFNRTVGLVVANALVGAEQGVRYSRRLDTYGPSPYRPDWLGSKRLLGVIDRLAAGGLVEVFEGKWGGMFSKGLQSSFKATSSLIEGLDELGIGLSAVRRDQANAPVIELKDENKRRISYDIRDKWVVQRTNELRAYNAFIDDQDISLRGRETPNFCGLTRIYNDGSWERGGRHYRGWWQSVPNTQRPGILINGEETVELDFGGFMTRALYHVSGLDFPGDPYDIPKIRSLFEVAGVDWLKVGRRNVKDVINVLLNVPHRQTIYHMKDKFIDLKVPLKKIVPLIIEYHAPIKDHFFKIVSPSIMNIEADICSDIILKGMTEKLVILPVFDAFISKTKDAKYMSNLMISMYKGKLGFNPAVHIV
jgi:hypothetical protein